MRQEVDLLSGKSKSENALAKEVGYRVARESYGACFAIIEFIERELSPAEKAEMFIDVSIVMLSILDRLAFNAFDVSMRERVVDSIVDNAQVAVEAQLQTKADQEERNHWFTDRLN